MAVTFDSILNVLIPALVILCVVGFIWVKFLAPHLWPWLKGVLEGSKQHGEARGKEIIYE